MKIKPKKPLRGKPLLRAAWNFIAEHPEKWNQLIPRVDGSNGCGCIGAHAARLAGLPYPDNGASDGLAVTQVSASNLDYLYHSVRTMPELRARVVKICGPRGLLPVPKGYE